MIREKPLQGGADRRRVLGRHDERRLLVPRELGDAAGMRGDARQASEHRLDERLRNALVRERWKDEDVERLQPGNDICLVAGEERAKLGHGDYFGEDDIERFADDYRRT